MRVTHIGLFSPNLSEDISFSLREPEPETRYIIRTIVGMDAEEIIPKFYGFSKNGQDRFYTFGLKSRDISMRISLNPRYRLDENYSDIRDELYRTISATRTGLVELQFYAGGSTVARIQGFIVKFEGSYFVKTPEVQLTIRCKDPMFRAINPVTFLPAALPTINPLKVPDSLSTSPHGFTMRITFKAASNTFTIQDVQTNPTWVFKVTPSPAFASGDVLYLSSEFSNKDLYRVRGATTTYLMDKVDPTSIWPVIFPGQNSFYIPEIATFNWNILEYYAAYWGV